MDARGSDDGPSADATAGSLPLLVVARWFPAVDGIARGRYVADQLEALVAAGGVDPIVASFQFVQLRGGNGARRRQRRALQDTALLRQCAEGPRMADGLTQRGCTSASAIPVARIPVPREPVACRIPGGEGDDHRDALLRFVGSLGEWRTSAGPGVVHAHTGYPDGFAAGAAADRLNWPLVITEHASFVASQLAEPEERRRYVAGIQRAARVIAVSQTLARLLRQEVPELGDRLEVIPNAVPVHDFRLAAAGERDGDELLYVGSLKEAKGVPLLLRALALARGERPRLRLRLVGRAPSRAQDRELHALAGELGLTDCVRFDGQLDRAAVAEAMAKAALFVHPSRYETFGVVAAEALASGLPVVATDSGGVTEIIGPEPLVHGDVVREHEPEALSRAILRTLERRTQFDEAALRRWVETRYSAAGVAATLLALYSDVLADAGAAATSARRPISRAPRAQPRVVIGFHRAEAADALEPLPPGLLAELILVTSAEPSEVALPSGLGDAIEIDLDGPYRGERDGAAAAREAARTRHAEARERHREAQERYHATQAAYQARAGADPVVVAAYREAREGYRAAREVLAANPAARPAGGKGLERLHRTAQRRSVRHAQLRLLAAQQAIGSALVSLGAAGRPPSVVCLGGFDYLAVEPGARAGQLLVAPAGTRWMADLWASREGVLGYDRP
ncbi:MAG: glycosyltransferase [Candidatus Limnocylindrales bacterium]